MTQATDELLARLKGDRALDNQERIDLLVEHAKQTKGGVDLLADVVAADLNRLERRIVLALDLDWPEGEPTAVDLAYVLKERAGPRANPRGGETDVGTQLAFLARKDWVRSQQRDDGTLYWELT